MLRKISWNRLGFTGFQQAENQWKDLGLKEQYTQKYRETIKLLDDFQETDTNQSS